MSQSARASGVVIDLGRVFVEALVILAVGVLLGLALNAARPDGLPLVATKPYETLVPCPEPGGPITALSADEARADSDTTFFIDARSPAAFADRHTNGARNVPYDYLEATPPALLESLTREISQSGKRRVVVVGDGGSADSGKELAKEISAAGIKNVAFVMGGAPAIFGAALVPEVVP